MLLFLEKKDPSKNRTSTKMKYKFLIVTFLITTSQVWAADSHEVLIVFACKSLSHDLSLHNEKKPIRRIFANRQKAFNFVKQLNKITHLEPDGSNRINALKRRIALTDSEKDELSAATFTPTAEEVPMDCSLLMPDNIYVQQIKPVRLRFKY